MKFFGPFFAVLKRVAFGFEVELSYKFRVADIWIGVAMAVEAPFHRERFHLGDDFHFVDATVTRNAADATIDMYCVVEINEIGKVVNAIPKNGLICFETFANGLQQRAFRFNDSQRYRLSGVVHFYPVATMTITTG